MEFLNLDIDLLPVNIVIFKKNNNDFNFVAFNKLAEKTEQISRDLLLGHGLTEIFPAEKKFGLFDVLLRVHATGKSEIYSSNFNRDDRTSGWRKNYIIKLPDETVAAIYQDCSLDKEPEFRRAIADEGKKPKEEPICCKKTRSFSERKFETFIEASKDWVWEVNQKGIYTYSSKSIENLLGYSAQEIIGKSPFDLMPEDEAIRVSTIFHEYSTKQQIISNLENLNIHKDGHQISLSTSATPIIDRSGKLTGYRGIDKDITLQKKAAEAIKGKKIADLKSQSKSDFLFRMSHELRTPLNAILGFGQLLELDSECLNKTQQSYVNEILAAGNHLLNLINEVLNLSKIESRKLDLSIETLNLHEVLSQSIQIIKPQLQTYKIQLIEKFNIKETCISADSTRLKQVFINLLSNALKYNSPQGIITVDSEVINGCIRISISDTGKGLSNDEMKVIFTPFERLDQGNHTEGTGIGLTITRSLVELMNGSIGVESEQGKGSTFWVEFAIVPGS